MKNVFIRAFFKPLDYIGFFNRRTLIFTGKTKETSNIYSFTFTPVKPFLWKGGQHGVFSLPLSNSEEKNWRAFSIASASHEREIRIATIINENPSAFKQALLQLKPNDTITLYGPFGELYFTQAMRTVVGVAGGVGITPFRALIEEIAHNKHPFVKLILIYGSQGEYAFRESFEAILPHPNITILYAEKPEDVNRHLDTQIEALGNMAHYFVSGSPGMIGALRTKLQQKGIRNIVHDTFTGY